MEKAESIHNAEIVLKRAAIFRDVIKERERQNAKHPEFPETDPERACILGEEVGEVSQAVNHLKELNLSPEEYRKHLRDEIIQVIAVGFRWLEHFPD